VCYQAIAQIPAAGKFVGTIREFSAATAEILIQPDGAETARVKVTLETQVQRVAPGDKDLRNAVMIPVTALAVGDRVYVAVTPGGSEARRIIVMPASEITKKQEAERQDWIARGVAGIVTARAAESITLRVPSGAGDGSTVVRTDSTTRFRRYAPDSVKFADAKPSSIAEVSPGDQMRARGAKSVDGQTMTAEEIVFGTFQTHAGSITNVNGETQEITISEMGSKRRLTIQLAADSQIKKMPDFGGPMGGMAPPGPAPGSAPAGPRPDFSQMLERMPPASIEDLKPGATIVVSSTKGQTEGKVTAIMLLANADMLIQMSGRGAGQGRRPDRGVSPGREADMGGLPGLGLDLTGMIP
jgi:hypothetical protein